MRTIKLTGRKNLTSYAFWLGPGRPTGKEIHVKMHKKYGTVLVHYLFKIIRIWIRIK
jgi:hypothetical protein